VSPATDTTSLAHFAEPDVRFTIGGSIGGDGAVTLVLDLGTFRAPMPTPRRTRPPEAATARNSNGDLDKPVAVEAPQLRR
jgi:hypothetical protein